VNAVQLEVLATQIIDGEISVENAESLCRASVQSRVYDNLWEVAYSAPVNEENERPMQDDSEMVEREEEQERREGWRTAEWSALRWPVVAFEPWDEERGMRADPTNVKSEASLEMEYAKPYTRTVTDYVRDPHGAIYLDDDGQRMTRDEEVVTMGSVEWEYRRRAQGRQPWMPKATWRFIQDEDRARLRRIEQRKAVIRLIEELGGDPRDPKVAEWVGRVGYDVALNRLLRRHAQTPEKAAA
jgi:hypothetical protein